MFESFELSWRLYNALPAQRFLMLLPWHFTALLLGLGVLAAIGIHHLIGWTFGFYSQGGFQRRIASAITLAVLIFSVQGLLLAYMLRTQADALVKPMLSPENAVQPAGVLGSILLDPAFSDTDLENETHVAKARLAATVIGTEDDDYRAGLEGFLVSPDRLVMAPTHNPAPDTAGGTDTPKQPDASTDAAGDQAPAFTNRDDLISAIAVQIGLRWIMDPEQTWPEAMPAGTGSAADPRLRVPEFVLALVDEIQDNAVLDRLDWEHVAGTRFVQAVLQPVLVERVARSAGLLAVGVVALDLAYFAVAARIFGRLRRRARAQDAESDGK
jgi:hypothetical protein